MSHKAGIGINAGESVGSTVKSGWRSTLTLVLFLSLKSLNQLYDAVHENDRVDRATVHFPIYTRDPRHHRSEEQQSAQKITGYGNLTTLSRFQNFSTNVSLRMKRYASHHMTFSGLYDAFGTDRFDELYVGYESNQSVPRKTVKAQELILDILKEMRDRSSVSDEHRPL